MIEALEDVEEEGIVVEGQTICDVRFPDNQGMVSGKKEGLERMMNKLKDTAQKV